MPVFLQGTAPQGASEQPQQVFLQPAPVDPHVKKLKAAKANVEKYQKRVKCTSTALIVAGGVGMACAFFHLMNAAKKSSDMIHGHHHGPHPHPHPNRTMAMEDDAARPERPRLVTEDQFELYDALKFMASIAFFISAKILAIGKCGKWIAWSNKIETTKRVQKKSYMAVALIAVMCLFAAHEGHKIKSIMRRVHHKHPHPKPEGEVEIMHHKGGRHLEEDFLSQTQAPMMMSQAPFMNVLKDAESDCNALKSESSCNAQSSKCSWCKSAAVADSCHSIENAKSLPAAVFQCSNIQEVEPQAPPAPPAAAAFVSHLLGDDEDYCSAFAEARCLKETEKCSWCKSGAVADACHSIENAMALPPSIFFCSNMGDLSVQVKKEVEPILPPPITVHTSYMFKDAESDCNALKSESSCNAQSSKCSWCKSAAVADSCHSIENAKSLPAAVFQCSNIQEVEPQAPPAPPAAAAFVSHLLGDDEDYCSAFAEARCLKETEKCSWCKSGAVADACHSIENAMALPPSIFFCSNMGDLSVQVEPIPPPPLAIDTSDMFKDDESDCNALRSESSCNAQSSKCSWCKSAAVADSCHSIENAKSLPAAVFQCSNIAFFN